jgi:hypothetical protein
MAKPVPPVFYQMEVAVLSAMYEVENGFYSSYTLAQSLGPTIEPGTPQAGSAFRETRDATERLIARGLVRGNRNRGADGVYFTSLKLTRKGEQAAIEQRKQAKETRNAIDEAMREGNKVAKGMSRKQ